MEVTFIFDSSYTAWSYLIRSLPIISLSIVTIVFWVKNRENRNLFHLFISSLVSLIILAVYPFFPSGFSMTGGESVDTDLIRTILTMGEIIPSIPYLFLGLVFSFIGYTQFRLEKTRENRYLLVSGILWLVFWLDSFITAFLRANISVLFILEVMDGVQHAFISSILYLQVIIALVAALFLSLYGLQRDQKYFRNAGILYIVFTVLGILFNSVLIYILQFLNIPL